MQKQIKQVWHDYRTWEEVEANMWGSDNVDNSLDKAIEFTSNHKLYGSFMAKVRNEWKISCERALTDPYLNHKAWIGHAAVAYALSIPEDVTRKAWGFLTYEQKYLANKEAEREVNLWKKHYIENRCIHKDMGGQMLLEWNT